MKPALLIIDLQVAWFNAQTEKTYLQSCEILNHLKQAFIKKGLPVFYIQHENPNNGILVGTPEAAFIDAIAPGEGDRVFVKRYGNAFNKTGLAETVKDLGIDTVMLGGYRAENCILSTARGALDLDLTAILVKGAIASPIPEHIAFVEGISDTRTVEDILQIIESL